LEVEVPRRAQYIRVITAELERIQSHLLWLGVAAHEVGFDTLFYYVWRDREVVLDIIEMLWGNRQHYAMNTIGVVRRDVTDESIPKIKTALSILDERTRLYANTIPKENTLIKRGDRVGKLKSADAIALGAAGPTLRMTGVKFDIRYNDPYQAYDEIPFEVVTSDRGDILGLVFVRLGELMQSIKITDYALDHIPHGPIRIRVPRSVPPNEAVSRTEAPRGEDVHFGRSNGTDKPERWKIRAPTYANIPSVCKMLVGGYVADIPIVLAGIDPCFSCTARVAFIDKKKDRKWMWTHEELRRYGIKWYGQH
jgi:Ni,Fe-hydrogenase III large subunit